MADSPIRDGDAPGALPGLSRRSFLQTAGLAGAGLAVGASEGRAAAPSPGRGTPLQAGGPFALRFEDGAVVSLKRVDDAVDTEYVEPGARLGDVRVRFRRGPGAWRTLDSTEAGVRRTVEPAPGPGNSGYRTTVESGEAGEAPELEIGLRADGPAFSWTVTVRNPSDRPLEVGDLAVPLPINRNRGRPGQDEDVNVGPPVLKHGLVSGYNSFLFWMRGNSVGPYLTLTVDEATKLEYWEADRAGYRVYVHSAAAAEDVAAHDGTWRQPHTALTLEPGGERRYGFTLRWADDYGHVRRILVEEGLLDVHVVPGMTVPSDLSARVALRARVPIHGVDAEFPDETVIRDLGTRGDARIFEVRFLRLGENRLRVRFGEDRHAYLEFFATEPVETLVAKRGAFIAAHQHRDPSLWYDGLLAEWAMDTRVLLGPDNYDRIEGWRIYEVSCDDPGLSKPAFLASKNAEYPVQEEVEALDRYVENFVWGGLQRTTEETFSYGIYGIPDWKQNRESDDPGRDGRQHLWRIYDYPHVVLTYFGLYRIARDHPHIRTAREPRVYLRRAYGTALAMFTIPWEIERWSAYGTGLYNELVIEDVIAALEAEGMRDEAERLRPHWERKVRTFVNEDPDLFRSEYAFDTTGFEATHALAKYALRVAEPETEVSRSDGGGGRRSTRIRLDRARAFMETQMAANIFCRGWLETAYYLLGSDIRGSGGNSYTLTYMSQMGGWAVLDYALHHAEDPWPYLRLGYASFLSAWALMNTGTPASNYGYWYSGAENDGGAGGGFEPAAWGRTWLGQPHHRGSWYYSCEIDLGFCGGLRGARTVLADDPLFGRFAFGGDWQEVSGGVAVTPRDGVRRRFHALLGGGRLHLESDVDRFAAGRPLVVAGDLTRIDFELESERPGAHTARLRLSGAPAGSWEVRARGAPALGFSLGEEGPAVVEVPVAAGRGAQIVRLVRVGP